MVNDRFALDVMISDMALADEVYRPTQFWRVALDKLVSELSSEGLEQFRALDGPLSYFVPTYGFPQYHSNKDQFKGLQASLERLNLPDRRCSAHLERLLSGEAQAEADYRVLLASDSDVSPFVSGFSESTVGAPIEQFEFDTRRFSRSSLNYLLGLAFLKRHCDTSTIRTVLEIGAGFGSLGEILLSDQRNGCFYVDVDIPPTLHAATYYLQGVLGHGAVLDYQAAKAMETVDLAEVSHTHRAAALATWQLPKVVGTVDLFVNFISFQEMEPEVVRNYLAHVDRLETRYVLLRNLREGKAKAKTASESGVSEPISGDMYDSFLDRYKLCATNTMPFGYLTVDGFHSELRLYVRR